MDSADVEAAEILCSLKGSFVGEVAATNLNVPPEFPEVLLKRGSSDLTYVEKDNKQVVRLFYSHDRMKDIPQVDSAAAVFTDTVTLKHNFEKEFSLRSRETSNIKILYTRRVTGSQALTVSKMDFQKFNLEFNVGVKVSFIHDFIFQLLSISDGNGSRECFG